MVPSCTLPFHQGFHDFHEVLEQGRFSSEQISAIFSEPYKTQVYFHCSYSLISMHCSWSIYRTQNWPPWEQKRTLRLGHPVPNLGSVRGQSLGSGNNLNIFIAFGPWLKAETRLLLKLHSTCWKPCKQVTTTRGHGRVPRCHWEGMAQLEGSDSWSWNCPSSRGERNRCHQNACLAFSNISRNVHWHL